MNADLAAWWERCKSLSDPVILAQQEGESDDDYLNRVFGLAKWVGPENVEYVLSIAPLGDSAAMGDPSEENEE